MTCLWKLETDMRRLTHSLFLDSDDAEVTPPKSPLMAGMSTAFSLVRKVSRKVSKPKQGRMFAGVAKRTSLAIF